MGGRGTYRVQKVVPLGIEPGQSGGVIREHDRFRGRIALVSAQGAVGGREDPLGGARVRQVEVQGPLKDLLRFPGGGLQRGQDSGMDADGVVEAVDAAAGSGLLVEFDEVPLVQLFQDGFRLRARQVAGGGRERHVEVDGEHARHAPVDGRGGGAAWK